MTVKKWLGRARYIQREIDLLQKTKQETRDQLTKITQSYEDNDGVQSTKDPHKFDRLAEIDGLIDEKERELIKAKADIMAAIFQLSEPMQRTVLLHHYVRGVPIKEVARLIHYSYTQTRRIHNCGIAIIEERLKRCGKL